MKKIIIAFDGTNFSDGAFEFSRRLNELSPILLTGIFVPQVQLASLWTYADGSVGPIPLFEEGESRMVHQNIDRFENVCRKNGIEYRVHRDFLDFPVQEIEKESLFADLLILGSEMFYENLGTDPPNAFLHTVLRGVKCPVIVVPEKFDFPRNIILAYDGSDDSVFAIKQFAYLFPEFTKKEAMLLFASDEKIANFPHEIEMEEFAARHFSHLTLQKLELNPRKFFGTWISERKSALLVSGSYGRSGISELFKRSFVREVIAAHRLPVFIAHR